MHAANFTATAIVLLLLGAAGCPDPELSAALDAGELAPTGTPDAGEDHSAVCDALLRETCGVTSDGMWRCSSSADCQIAYVISTRAPEECASHRQGPQQLVACAEEESSRVDNGAGAQSPAAAGDPLCMNCGIVDPHGALAADDGGVAQDAICAELERVTCGEHEECATARGCTAAREVTAQNRRSVCFEALGDEPSFPHCQAP